MTEVEAVQLETRVQMIIARWAGAILLSCGAGFLILIWQASEWVSVTNQRLGQLENVSRSIDVVEEAANTNAKSLVKVGQQWEGVDRRLNNMEASTDRIITILLDQNRRAEKDVDGR